VVVAVGQVDQQGMLLGGGHGQLVQQAPPRHHPGWKGPEVVTRVVVVVVVKFRLQL
jgi:hypothetical protein